MDQIKNIDTHKKAGWCLCMLLAFALPGLAQVRFYSLVSENQVSYNQTFQVQYVIEGAKNIQQFNIPDFSDFQLEEVFELPATPALDPKTLKLVDQHSKIAILTPVRTGVFLIPGATAIVDGKKMRSNSIKVNVKASPLSRNLPESSGRVVDGSELKEGENIEDKVRDNFFVRAEVSKPVCYAGEPIMATYKAYSRVNANSHVVRRPSFTGFSVIEMVDGYESNPTVEQYNGAWYYVHLIRKVQLFPLQAGKYELDPAEIEGTIHFIRHRSDSRSPAYEQVDHPVIINTLPVPVTVLPLPDSLQPENFGGAVGQYSMSVKTLNPTSKKGELLQLQVTISGSGNLPLVIDPPINWPAGVDASEPQVKTSINKYAYPLTGSKTFTYALAINASGPLLLPPVTFSFFDPVSRRYKTLQRDSIPLDIGPAATAGDEKEKITESSPTTTFPRERIAFGLIAAAILTWIGIQLYRSNKRKPVQTSKEDIQTVDPFATARMYAVENNDEMFFNEMLQQLCAVAGQKCQVVPSSFNKRNIRVRLLELGITPDIANEFNDLMDTCEQSLYGAYSSGRKNKMELLDRAEKISAIILRKS